MMRNYGLNLAFQLRKVGIITAQSSEYYISIYLMGWVSSMTDTVATLKMSSNEWKVFLKFTLLKNFFPSQFFSQSDNVLLWVYELEICWTVEMNVWADIKPAVSGAGRMRVCTLDFSNCQGMVGLHLHLHLDQFHWCHPRKCG